MKIATQSIARAAWLWRNRKAFAQEGSAGKPVLHVDVSAILRHDAQTGIQRVVRAVWAELVQRDGQEFAVRPVYATQRHGYCYAPRDFLARGQEKPGRVPVRMRSGDKFLGLDLSAHILPKYRPQLKAWRRVGASIHLVIYDLLPLTRPDWFNAPAASHFRKWYDLLTQEADQAICISDQVAHELRQRLAGRPASRRLAIGRLRMGCDIAGSIPSTGVSPEVAQLVARLRFRRAVLMVGTIEPRKGYDVALAAFERLWKLHPGDAPDLVIVGKGGWKTAQLQARIRSHPEHRRRLHWLDRVSDEGLCQLYEACRGLLMTSHGEGFGLPLIEAAMYGRPVLARDLPVFREQALPAANFFVDDSSNALSDDILRLAEAGSHSAPLPALPRWADCVDGLLVELRLATVDGSDTGSELRQAS